MPDWKKLFDDAVTQIGEGAKVAGEGLAGVADEARKVVGLGVGSLEILPDKKRWALGDTIEGTLKLTLREPVAAKRLVVALRATRKRLAVENLGGRRSGSTFKHECAFEFESTVEGEQTFESGEFRFEIDVPLQIDTKVDAGGLLGDALRAAQAVKSMTDGQLRWTLAACLEIPWRRNVSSSIDVAIREVGPDTELQAEADLQARFDEAELKAKAAAKAAAKTASAASSSSRRPTTRTTSTSTSTSTSTFTSTSTSSPSFRPPEAVSLPEGWVPALEAAITSLRKRGFTVIHEHRAPPLQPSAVMEVLARNPDLDPEVLQFYGVMDGYELIVGQPRMDAERYAAAEAAKDAAHGGRVRGLDRVFMHDTIGPALTREFCDGMVRVLEVPALADLFTDTNPFTARDGHDTIFGPIVVGPRDYYGLTRADEIRAWRQPRPGQPPRDGYYDQHADDYQTALGQRDPAHWWVLHARDGGASLDTPARLLRWSEMLRACLDHLVS